MTRNLIGKYLLERLVDNTDAQYQRCDAVRARNEREYALIFSFLGYPGSGGRMCDIWWGNAYCSMAVKLRYVRVVVFKMPELIEPVKKIAMILTSPHPFQVRLVIVWPFYERFSSAC